MTIISMTKPSLPSMPKELRSRTYTASGICPAGPAIAMLGIGILGGAAIGAIGHYVSSLVPILVMSVYSLLAGLAGGCLGILLLLSGGIIAIAIGLAMPVILGFAIGRIIWAGAKRVKCRSPKWAGAVGLVGGVAAYVPFALVAVRTSGDMRLTSGFDVLISSLVGLSGTQWWQYVLFGIEGVILILVSRSVAMDYVSSTAFCEGCQEWYVNHRQDSFSPSLAGPLVRSFMSGSSELTAEDIVHVPSDSNVPYLVLSLRKCPSCTTSEFEFGAKVVWQEIESGKDDEKKVKVKEETWLKTMVPSHLGEQIETVLYSA